MTIDEAVDKLLESLCLTARHRNVTRKSAVEARAIFQEALADAQKLPGSWEELDALVKAVSLKPDLRRRVDGQQLIMALPSFESLCIAGKPFPGLD